MKTAKDVLYDVLDRKFGNYPNHLTREEFENVIGEEKLMIDGILEAMKEYAKQAIDATAYLGTDVTQIAPVENLKNNLQ
jgi:hypothetical protein